MECDLGGTQGKVSSGAYVHPQQQGEFSSKLSHQTSKGVVEACWSQWSYLGGGRFHVGGIPVFV